ncbi:MULTISPECIES: Ger(x)C family spore germination protein [Paenibacillus]|uniref:Germination protein n=2 Tax=Paenibacillus TaxID=44249 RepID=A0A920CIJ2_9BACL|nr:MULTISPECIES: Ger(x)C family spore germination protein [Paenibacillus]MBU5673298.1 Ger(x)C family spore germination protein [Paenibacillus brevis]GIO38379.1 germination protein [Paenibacillus antibioticophila]
MRKSAVSILILCMVLNLTGCWSNREVNDIAIVTATGLDLTKEGKFRLSLLLAVPLLIGTATSQGTGTTELAASAGWLVAEDGDTVMDAYRNLQQKLPRKIFFSHNRVIIIGKQLAAQGMVQALDFFQRYRQSQMKNFLAISETTALELMQFQPKFEKLASEVLVDEFDQQVLLSVRLVDFLNILQSQGVEPAVPMLEIVSSGKGQPKNKGTNLSVSGTAVFKEDRMIGKLNSSLSRDLLWVLDSLKEGVITIDVEHAQRKGKISAELEKVDVKRKIEVSGGRVKLKLKVKVAANIYENTSSMDLEIPENTQLTIHDLKQDIKARIERTIKYVQSNFNSDIFGFGQTMYRVRPSVWKSQYRERWEAVFPEVEPIVEVEVRVLRNGLTNKTIKLSEVNP